MDTLTKNFNDWKNRLDQFLHEQNAFTKVLVKIENVTRVDRVYLVYGLGVIFGVYLIIGYGAHFLCNFVGFVFPAYFSVKAIESEQKDDDTRWLIYWVVYSAFSFVELFADIFLFWIPLFWFFKCIFLLWCMLPGVCSGSHFLYYQIIRPVFLRHEAEVDAVISAASSMAHSVIGEAAGAVQENLIDENLVRRHVASAILQQKEEKVGQKEEKVGQTD